MGEAVAVAVDGGNSKTDVVAFGLDGRLVGRAAATSTSPHNVGLDGSIEIVSKLVAEAAAGHPVAQASLYLAGLDLSSELAAYREAVRQKSWSSATTVVDNDIFALLRAGTGASDAVAVICGAGLNAVGVREDGRTARFLALGAISGDWGGGDSIGETALWHASRGADSRGDRTVLELAIPEHFGLGLLSEVTEALHLGRLSRGSLGELAPVVFAAARLGDKIAGSIVDRQAAEIATMAASCIIRLGLVGAVPVVLGGGVLRSGDARLLKGVTQRLAELAPSAVAIVVDAPPVLGAALLALEHAGAGQQALAAARAALVLRSL
ncbi:MAG TPA: BadF/BadG/BcrA/BcrD ATPase family protein [Galbitalea sp.]|nr:BadF/BadG/BcrA/BcrD ATPase family protein [Galbitalea sp.]